MIRHPATFGAFAIASITRHICMPSGGHRISMDTRGLLHRSPQMPVKATGTQVLHNH
jgi:hypothetical protein